MSLLGKILALLNIFGAFGLVYLASVDYARRQTWAYAAMRHELSLRGLPLDEQEIGRDNVPVVEKFTPDTLNSMFGGGVGAPVATQKKEVERVKQQTDAKVAEAGQNKIRQSYLLARILLPLADTYPQREQLLACLTHFANDAAAKALETRAQAAFKLALAAGKPVPGGISEKPMRDVYRVAFRAEAGPPAEHLAGLIVDAIDEVAKGDRAKAEGINFAQLYDKVLEDQRKELEGRYNAAFELALVGKGVTTPDGDIQQGIENQKQAVARLLLGLCPFTAEEIILAGQGSEEVKKLLSGPDRARAQMALVNSDTYKKAVMRVHVVCGIRQGIYALTGRSQVLRRLGDYVAASVLQERDQFVLDHDTLIGLIREQVALVKIENTIISNTKDKIAAHTTTINARKKEIEGLKDDLQKVQDQTAKNTSALHDSTRKVLEHRIKLRDDIEAIARGERRLRELEQQIRELERKR